MRRWSRHGARCNRCPSCAGRERQGTGGLLSAERNNHMKFLGKIKPFLIPIVCGVVGAYLYDRFVKAKLPQALM